MVEKTKKPGFVKNLLITGQKTRFIVIISSIVVTAVFFMLAVFSLLGFLNLFLSPLDFVIFALLSGTGIYGFFEYFRLRRIYKIDLVFPNFIRDIAESRRAGMTFTKAILFAAKGNYGILTRNGGDRDIWWVFEDVFYE